MAKNLDLVGSLFPTVGGRQTRARTLSTSLRALTLKQKTDESTHQQTLFRWLGLWSKHVPEFARSYHPANELISETVTRDTTRGRVTYSPAGAKRKAEGVKPGILDVANHAQVTHVEMGEPWEGADYKQTFSGLFIELKVRHNELIDDASAEWDQVRELAWLRSQDKSAHVVWSWAEAAALHAWYFQVQERNVWMSIGKLDVWLAEKLGGHDRRCGCDVNLEGELRRAIV